METSPRGRILRKKGDNTKLFLWRTRERGKRVFQHFMARQHSPFIIPLFPATRPSPLQVSVPFIITSLLQLFGLHTSTFLGFLFSFACCANPSTHTTYFSLTYFSLYPSPPSRLLLFIFLPSFSSLLTTYLLSSLPFLPSSFLPPLFPQLAETFPHFLLLSKSVSLSSLTLGNAWWNWFSLLTAVTPMTLPST